MSNTTEKQQSENPTLYSEGRGQYTLLKDNKVYFFQFPINNSVEENLASISFLRNEVLQKLQNMQSRDSEKKSISTAE